MPEWRPWTYGQRNTTLVISKKEEYKRKHPPVRLGDPTPEELRGCIKDGYCWWCDRGGWKNLAGHTSRAHGITADNLREMAGLFKHIPTCLPELYCAMAERMKQQLKDGTSKLPKPKALGYKINFSEAGRKYQDEVRKKTLIENTPKGLAKLVELRLQGRHFGQPFRPHNCPACGKVIPTSHPITCSPECRKVIRQRTAMVSHAIMKRLSDENPEYRLKINLKLSEAAKKQYREGRQLNNPAKPHPCRMCGTIIPYATPRLCSVECRHKAWQGAQLEALANRTLIIPKNARPIIARRFQAGESSIVIAREYGISPRYVRLIGKIFRMN